MSLQETIQTAISGIQEEQCRNCEAGKCLISLKSLLDDADPVSVSTQSEQPAQPKPTAKKPAFVKTSGPTVPKKAPAAPPGTKRCSRCKDPKTLDQYTKKNGTSDGLDIYCRDCKKIIAVQYKENKKQKTAARASKKEPLPVLPAEIDEDGFYNCTVPGCMDGDCLGSQEAYEQHYRLRHGR